AARLRRGAAGPVPAAHGGRGHRARGRAHGHRGRSARLGQRRAHRRRAGCPGDHHRCRPPRPGHGPAGHRGPGPAPRRVSRVEADDRGWHLGSRTSLVLPDGTRAWVTVGAIYTSRNLAGDTVLPIKLWAPHALQLTASELFVKLAPGTSEPAVQAAITRA